MTTLLKLFRTTTFKMALTLALLFASAAGLAAIYIYWNANRLLEERLTETLQAETRGLAEQYRSGGLRRLIATVKERIKGPGDNIYLVFSQQVGQRIAGNVRVLPREFWDAEGRIAFTFLRQGDSGFEERLAVAHIYRLGAGFRLMVGRDVDDQQQFSRDILRGLLGGLAFILLMGLAGGWLVSRNLLQRIDNVTSTSQAIITGDMSQRVPVIGSGDELDRMALNLNDMLERIEQLMIGLREVSDNIAHDLKTPLSRLRNRVETVLRDGREQDYRVALETTIEESDELIRTFNALLSIARLEAGSSGGEFELYDLQALLSEVAELYEPLAEENGIELILRPGKARPTLINRQLIGQAVANLIENAIKYGRPDEESLPPRIELAAGGAPGLSCIEVRDNGAGISPAERETALKRFGRLEKSRTLPGTGLGLSMVAAIARLHGGELELDENAPGLICRLKIQNRD